MSEMFAYWKMFLARKIKEKFTAVITYLLGFPLRINIFYVCKVI